MASADAMRLGLTDAVRLAGKQNFDVVLEQKQVRITEHGVAVADGAFEPVVTAGYLHSDTDSPPVTLQQGEAGQIITYIEDAWQAQIAKLWSFGTRTSLGIQSGRTRSSAGTAVEPLNDRSQLQLSITQPVLRGFGTDRTLQTIDVIRARITSSKRTTTASFVTLLPSAASHATFLGPKSPPSFGTTRCVACTARRLPSALTCRSRRSSATV